MAKIWVKLGDPSAKFEDGKTKITGTEAVHIETTEKIDRAIRGGILVKIRDDERVTLKGAADNKEPQKKS
jgi:hypothetical protein